MNALTTSGRIPWKTQVNGAITASAAVAGSMLVFGDQAGYLYGITRGTGAIAWSFRPVAHPYAAIWGSGTVVGADVVIGVASNEEAAAANPSYPCAVVTPGTITAFGL